MLEEKKERRTGRHYVLQKVAWKIYGTEAVLGHFSHKVVLSALLDDLMLEKSNERVKQIFRLKKQTPGLASNQNLT